MEEFKSLISTLESLLAPDGCPWDREQTLQSMRHLIVEETYEVIEAIDLEDDRLLEEELGDLLFNVVFICKLAEHEQRFSLKDVLKHIVAKLIRRHPHIFGDKKLKTSEEVLKQWESIKKTEEKAQPRHSHLDGIPKDLPALARAQKVAKKIAGKQFTPRRVSSSSPEEIAGESLWTAVEQMAIKGIEAEQALRKRLSQIEAEFREWEQLKSSG